MSAKPKSDDKNMPPPAAAASVAAAAPISDAAPVISLDEDEQIKEATKRSLKDVCNSIPASKKAKTGNEGDVDDVIVILSDDESIGTLDLCDDDDDDDDEVIVIELSSTDTMEISRKIDFDADANDDGDLVVVGEKNVMRLPHMRQHCTKCVFVPDLRRKICMSVDQKRKFKEDIKNNSKSCDLCYCFVCDKLASECGKWYMGDYYTDHCNASDKGINALYYKRLREDVKRDIVTPSPSEAVHPNVPRHDDVVTPSPSEAVHPDVPRYDDDGIQLYTGHRAEKGPFKPEDAGAKRSGICTSCRRCSWYNLFEHHNFTKNVVQDINAGDQYRFRKQFWISPKDFCEACGRIASTRDFEKEQSIPFRPTVDSVSLGTKVISFKLKVRDPRKERQYKKNWERYGTDMAGGWVYDEKEMEEDMFKHRIGKRPILRQILHAIPIVEHDSIPEVTAKTLSDPRACPFETEAILLDNQNDLTLLRELEMFDKQLRNETEEVLALNIHANWDSSARKGTIEITAHILRNALVSNTHSTSNNIRRQEQRKAMFSRLLLSWFTFEKFKLSELTCGMRVSPLSRNIKKDILRSSTGLIRPKLSHSQTRDLADQVEDSEVLREYNKEAEEISNNIALKSSIKSADDCGVIASNDVSFAGTMKRFTSSCLIDDVLSLGMGYPSPFIGRSSLAAKLGIMSTHREMLTDSHQKIRYARPSYTYGFTSYLDQKEHGLTYNLHRKFQKVSNRCETINGLLQQLENLGHAEAPQPEGLNVELFDYQRQAIGWALEREREGGVERFLWTKLPTEVPEVDCKVKTSAQLYYSPVLDMFSRDEPRDIRGGLIAAQMGLGKTVISLSLILLNPAPEEPSSGTSRKYYREPTPSANRIAPSWPRFQPLPANAPKKRGHIVSRGTLVVCNVSLVGQWIDEAKSKLKDPGLVYSYHGQGRTRDASQLAQKSVVVTTYAILASDVFHHSQKSNDPNYCAPCEQVRWWRIICDESHSIKDKNTRNYKALKRITAGNKWAVTGTPMNTTLLDLKGQLSFIGIKHIDRMFSIFSASMPSLSKKNMRGNTHRHQRLGAFLFLMKNTMIRHSISQTHRNSKVGIMSLPPKEEIIIQIEFSATERKEYDRIQNEVASSYSALKISGDVNKHYLKLNSALLPLRIACSGGQIGEGHIVRKLPPKKQLKGNELQLDLDPNEVCSICLDKIEEPCATKCKPVPHIFCKQCIDGVFSSSNNVACPCCRTMVTAKDLRCVVPKSSESTEIEIKTTSDNEKPSKKKADKTLKDSDIMFRSKFEMLLIELTRIRDSEPGSKSLIFSQFTSTLQWIKQELPKHGFNFRTLSGDMTMKKRAEALREFQSDPTATIFLLSMRSGAVGINLTQANRVFLMEPAMNPALEAQAIGRVYRLGQTKSVQIIKLCMKNSFESRLIKVLRRKFGTISKPSTLNSAEQEKKTDDRGSETNEKVVGGSDSPAIATLGHMTKDKAELMTEEFDALFGLTEPEDLPEIKEKEEEEENDSTPSSPSSARSSDSESYNSLAPFADQAHQRGPLFWRSSPSEDEDEDGCEIS